MPPVKSRAGLVHFHQLTVCLILLNTNLDPVNDTNDPGIVFPLGMLRIRMPA